MGRYRRNDPCWCGSGKKYKKCHLEREQQNSGNPWDAVEANKKAFNKKKCFAQDIGLGPCEGSIVQAHTISRRPNLAEIAINGHVTQNTVNIDTLNEIGRKAFPIKIGIKKASVFNGFCRKHDVEIFSCVENEEFVGRPDQCLAVAFRTLSRELSGKDAQAHLRETLRDADKGQPLINQIHYQKYLEIVSEGNEAAIKEIGDTHSKLSKALANKNYDIISSKIIEICGPLPFMVAGAWSPITDIFGRLLQEVDRNTLLEQITISSHFCGAVSRICFSWRKIENPPGQSLVDQITNLPLERQCEVILQLAVKHVENIYFNSNWFNALTLPQREQLDTRINLAGLRSP